jgi:hypothetical protein
MLVLLINLRAPTDGIDRSKMGVPDLAEFFVLRFRNTPDNPCLILTATN